MKLSDSMARSMGALIGGVAFVAAMNVYIFAPLHHSFRTAWIPYVVAWGVYRLAWARLSVLQRCSAGCGARIYYRLEVCPHCLTPVQRQGRGSQVLRDDLRTGKLGRAERG